MKKKKKKNTIHYSRIIIFSSLLLFCLIIGRIIQLGLSEEIDGTNLKKLASSRTTKTDIIQAKRGSIYSANNDLLATNVASYKLIEPFSVQNNIFWFSLLKLPNDLMHEILLSSFDSHIFKFTSFDLEGI